jgi:hypothetical protein
MMEASSRLSQLLLDYLGLQSVPFVEPTAVIVLIGVLAVTVVACCYSSTFTCSAKKTSTNTTSTIKKPLLTPTGPPPANDVWEERRRRGIAPNSSSKKEHYSGKPFGSSYYFAHNSVNAKGGYTDGLRMEDFTMNGPRLLSKNGMSVSATVTEAPEEAKELEPTTSSSAPPTLPAVTPAPPPATSNSTPITKYLWDDPGDASGIATIRIDTLPPKGNNTSNLAVPWKDANIVQVTATLEGEGLLVIATDGDKHEYRLSINRLFDKATQVRTVVKPKRLLIKIHKQRKGHLNFLGKSNLEAWPHPQRK